MELLYELISMVVGEDAMNQEVDLVASQLPPASSKMLLALEQIAVSWDPEASTLGEVILCLETEERLPFQSADLRQLSDDLKVWGPLWARGFELETGEDLVVWAERRGLKNVLDTSVHYLMSVEDVPWEVGFLASDEDFYRIRDFIHATKRNSAFQVLSLVKTAEEWARAYLHRMAKVPPARPGEFPRWDKPPERPILARLAEQLAELHKQYPKSRTSQRREGKLIFKEDPLSVELRFSAWSRPRLLLAGFGRETLSVECCSVPQCANEWMLIARLRDLVHGPQTPEQDRLYDLLSTPNWAWFLKGIRRAAEGVDTNAQVERLAWRVGREGEHLCVVPVIQKRGRRGWSKGAVQKSGALDHRRELFSSVDRTVFDIIGFGDGYVYHHLGDIMDALVGHSLVFHMHTGERVDVVRGTVTSRLVPGPGGLTPIFELEGRRLFRRNLTGHVLVNPRYVLLLESNCCVVARVTPELADMIRLAMRQECEVPFEAQGALTDIVETMQRHVPVAVPDDLRKTTVELPSDPVLRLMPQGDGLSAELVVRNASLERAWVPGVGADEILGVQGEAPVCFRRDLAAEQRAAEALERALGRPSHPEFRWSLPNPEEALELLHRAQALELEIEWPKEDMWRVRSASPKALRVRVSRGADWFGVEGEIQLDGAQVALADVLKSVREGRRYLRLGPGRFARLEDALLKHVRETAETVFSHQRRLGAGLAAVEPLDALAEAGAEVECDEAWRVTVSRMKNARNFEPELPIELQAELRDYQRDGFSWLARMSEWNAGVCLADEMGLGKTVQTIAVMLHRRATGPQLVVAPTSVGPNWMAELARFAPSLSAVLYRGSDRDAHLEGLGAKDVLVTSYDIATLDQDALSEISWGTLILDEAQAVKNAKTQRAKALRKIPAEWRLALTGTPVENHLGDLWSLFHIVSPGLLGSWEHFRDRFGAPIEREQDVERKQALARLVRPFILRRTKAQVALELPPRTEITRTIELSDEERALYEGARTEAVEALLDSGAGADQTERFQILAAISRLRRLACHPRLVHKSSPVTSSKLAACLELVDLMIETGERALIFSQFTSYLALLREALDARKVSYLYLDGSTPSKKRTAAVEAWKDGEVPLFVISLKAGGTGLNLVGADYVIHLDPWWNPAVEDQATDRTHRIGQDRPVTVVRMVAQGTIEEAVLSLHAQKRALAKDVLEGTETAARLSSEELIDLIRFGENTLPEERLVANANASKDNGAIMQDGDEALSQSSDSVRLDAVLPTDVDKITHDTFLELEPDVLTYFVKQRLTHTTMNNYLRVYNRIAEFAKHSRLSPRSTDEWIAAFQRAVDAGETKGSKSDKRTAGTVLRRVEPLLFRKSK